MHKIVAVLILLLLSNCQRNPVIKTHGVPFLDKKQKNLTIEKSNKNDVKKILGHPSTVAIFDNSIWIYIERTRTRGTILKLGRNYIKKNNVLIIEFNKYGVASKKAFYDKESMKQVNFAKTITENDIRKENFIYSFLASIRQKMERKRK